MRSEFVRSYVFAYEISQRNDQCNHAQMATMVPVYPTRSELKEAICQLDLYAIHEGVEHVFAYEISQRNDQCNRAQMATTLPRG